MALEAIEVILFVALFALDAYAFGNLNEIRRAAERSEARKGDDAVMRLKEAVAEEVAAEPLAPAEARAAAAGIVSWQAAPGLEHEFADMKTHQAVHEERVRELEEKISAMEGTAGTPMEFKAGEKMMEKLGDIRESTRKLTERMGEVEREVSAHVAESRVERGEVMQKIEEAEQQAEKKVGKFEARVEEKLKKAPAGKRAGKRDGKLAKKLRKLEKKLKQVELEESALKGDTTVGQSALLERIEKVSKEGKKLEKKVRAKTRRKKTTTAKKPAKKTKEKAGTKKARKPRKKKTVAKAFGKRAFKPSVKKVVKKTTVTTVETAGPAASVPKIEY